ncbi:MAG: hypothetical protein R2747_07995 [Pyrinomonadaceae bacterium]
MNNELEMAIGIVLFFHLKGTVLASSANCGEYPIAEKVKLNQTSKTEKIFGSLKFKTNPILYLPQNPQRFPVRRFPDRNNRRLPTKPLKPVSLARKELKLIRNKLVFRLLLRPPKPKKAHWFGD